MSEILTRAAPGGTSVEPAFTLVDEGLGAQVDLSRPAIVRAALPLTDPSGVRAAVDQAERELGHLQAFGLRPIGELTARVVHEADWANAWKAHFPVLRIGRRIVIRPTWRRHRPQPDDVVIALDPGMAFGTGLHPTTRLCLAALEGFAERGAIGDSTRVLDVGSGSGILAIAAGLLGAHEVLAVDVDPIAVEASRANARRNRLGRVIRTREGSVPTGVGPFDLVLANLIAGLLVTLADPLVAELRPGGALLASGIFHDRETHVVADLRGSRPRAREPLGRGRLGRAGARSAPLSPATALRYDRPTVLPALAPLLPIILVTHITLAVALFVPSLLLPFTLRNRLVAAGYKAPEPGPFVGALLWIQAHGTLVIGAGLALTGLALIAVLGTTMLEQPWLLVSLLTYASAATVAFAVQRPSLRRLLRREGIESEADREAWRARARRQRYVAYGITTAVGVIGFLMSTKPALW